MATSGTGKPSNFDELLKRMDSLILEIQNVKKEIITANQQLPNLEYLKPATTSIGIPAGRTGILTDLRTSLRTPDWNTITSAFPRGGTGF